MDNNKAVLGHLHKDFTKSDFIIFLVGSTIILVFAIFISVYFKILGVYIGALVLTIISVAIMTADIYAYKKSKRLCEEIITYHETEEQFIIKYKNRFLEVLDPIILFSTQNEGFIIFILNDGKKIKTLKIKEVVQTYAQIKEIIKQINI